VCTLDISMPGYVQKQLLKYIHVISSCPQYCPYSPPEPKIYGSEAQSLLPLDTMHKLSDSKIKQVQKIVGSILYYARTVDMTVLMALSTIASKQTTGTAHTMENALQVLDYLATHPNATMPFQVPDMIMNIHSKVLYLTEPKSCSRDGWCGALDTLYDSTLSGKVTWKVIPRDASDRIKTRRLKRPSGGTTLPM
jgi:hypothetical protein